MSIQANNQNQMSFDMDLSPAEWFAVMRKTIREAKAKRVNTVILENQQKQAFNHFKQKFIAGRV